ncbi:unnamed protein product [Brassica napus]|uniref:(rape) hypothetical protein n=1 Tax=Brassica napus TaxID=3708 RepID=A0A816RM81_BRANA|nr:unnamed protein product [Brassica napus]
MWVIPILTQHILWVLEIESMIVRIPSKKEKAVDEILQQSMPLLSASTTIIYFFSYKCLPLCVTF